MTREEKLQDKLDELHAKYDMAIEENKELKEKLNKKWAPLNNDELGEAIRENVELFKENQELKFFWRSHLDSNPGYRRENPLIPNSKT